MGLINNKCLKKLKNNANLSRYNKMSFVNDDEFS